MLTGGMKKQSDAKSNLTINDIARIAGVSKKSISRVINNEAGVSEATRTRIQTIIDKNGYVPSRHARAFAKSQSYLIGLAYNNLNPGYVLELLRGVQSVATQAGYEIVMHSVDAPVSDLAKNLIGFMRRSACDALLVSPPLSESASLVAALEKEPWPVVRIAGDDINANMMQVSYDDRAAAQEITHKIVENGHKMIGFIGGSEAAGPTRRRLAGFKDALNLHGISMPESHIRFGDFTFLSGLEVGAEMMNLPQKPTAIFCANDEMAAGLIQAIRNAELRVPKHISVVGFDDSALAQQVWPPLTTVKQPVYEMAAKATELLLGISQPSSAKLPEEFKHEIILRRSLGGILTGQTP